MSTEGEYVGPVERSIRDAIARGEFDNLSGTGKPSRISTASTTPIGGHGATWRT